MFRLHVSLGAGWIPMPNGVVGIIPSKHMEKMQESKRRGETSSCVDSNLSHLHGLIAENLLVEEFRVSP
jgi:hypothetical protein